MKEKILIEQLLGEPELERLERTTSLTNIDNFCEAIGAFANDISNSGKPGYLIIGVNDKGELAGTHITDKFLLTLSSPLNDGNIIPFPQMTIDKHSLPGGDIAVVVEPSLTPPVRYKGRCFIRVGLRKSVATAEEERRLVERRSAVVLPLTHSLALELRYLIWMNIFFPTPFILKQCLKRFSSKTTDLSFISSLRSDFLI